MYILRILRNENFHENCTRKVTILGTCVWFSINFAEIYSANCSNFKIQEIILHPSKKPATCIWYMYMCIYPNPGAQGPNDRYQFANQQLPNRFDTQSNRHAALPGQPQRWRYSPLDRPGMGQGVVERGQEDGMGMKNRAQPQQPLNQQTEQEEEVKDLRIEDQDGGDKIDEDDKGMDEQAFNPENEEEKALDLREDGQKTGVVILLYTSDTRYKACVIYTQVCTWRQTNLYTNELVH